MNAEEVVGHEWRASLATPFRIILKFAPHIGEGRVIYAVVSARFLCQRALALWCGIQAGLAPFIVRSMGATIALDVLARRAVATHRAAEALVHFLGQFVFARHVKAFTLGVNGAPSSAQLHCLFDLVRRPHFTSSSANMVSPLLGK